MRRAVSAAYYAVFHMLIDAGSRFVVRGNNRTPLRHAATRAFDHGEMKKAANSFAGGTLPKILKGAVSGTIPAELKRVCEAFIELQQARHEADYDRTRMFTRREVLDLVGMAEHALKDWTIVEGSEAADAFVVTMLLRSKLDR